MTLIHVQRWDWAPFYELISAWREHRPKVGGNAGYLHAHHCPGCKHEALCYKPTCHIILGGGSRVGVDQGIATIPYGNPDKCKACI